MFRSPKQTGRWIVIAVAIGLFCFSQALAKNNNGNGGGGGDDPPEAAAFSVIELPGFSRPHAVSNPNSDGFVTIAGDGVDGRHTSATYAVVDVNTLEVVSGLLPEPTDDGPVDRPSTARDVNERGEIVGLASVYDESGERHSVPIRWFPAGSAYEFELLPLPSGHTSGYVVAINEAGEMVGGSGTAAYWSADGQQIVELNSLLPENSGWSLVTAVDINSSRQVVGYGLLELDGVTRGYLLDLNTLEITRVPLVAGAETNEAWQINELGNVIGKMGGWGFYWEGPGTEPQLLGSSTNGVPVVRGINLSSELAGDSIVLDRKGNEEDTEMCSWLLDAETGGFTTAPLETLIPTKPKWDLNFGFGINDDLWIVGTGRKVVKGQTTGHGVLLAPNL